MGLGGLTVVGLVVIGGSLVARPLAEILGPGGTGLPPALRRGSLAYAAAALAAGGAVSAWIAPGAPLRHALALGLVAGALAPLVPGPGGPGVAAGALRAGLALAVTLVGGWLYLRLRRRPPGD